LLLFCFIPSLASAGIEVPESIRSFMNTHCYRCHGAKTQEADLSLHDMTRAIRDSADALNWQDILDKLNAGEMPPEGMQGEPEIKAMFKMILAAWQIDATRVVTYRMPDAGLLQSMGVSSTPHTLSHYGSNVSLHELNLKRTTKWMQLYSGFIDQLRSAKDPLDPNGGTLFDNSLVYNGGGLRTAHRTTNVPCLLTGGGFKALTYGHHRVASKENTPLANLWTTMLQDAGVPVERFADANATATSIWS
jgi:hypothetical protein